MNEEERKKIIKIGALAATLDCMDMQEAWARQKIFDMVCELTGLNQSDLFREAIDTSPCELIDPTEIVEND